MKTSKFDITDYLGSKEMIIEYLKTVLVEGNDSDVVTAIKHIEKVNQPHILNIDTYHLL